MTSIGTIINNYRTQMQSAGLLREAEGVKLSPRVAGLRPSLVKINRALAENPDLLRQLAQPSPFQILFEYTLPKLEPVLNELGPEKAERIVKKLCDYGKKAIAEMEESRAHAHLKVLFEELPQSEKYLKKDGIFDQLIKAYRKYDLQQYDVAQLRTAFEEFDKYIVNKMGKLKTAAFFASVFRGRAALEKKYGKEAVDRYYEHLFNDLPGFEQLFTKRRGIQEVTEAYQKLDLDKDEKAYLETIYGGAAIGLTLDAEGMIGLEFRHMAGMDNSPTPAESIFDQDLFALKNVKGIKELSLAGTKVTGPGLAYISHLKGLTNLNLWQVQIRDQFLAHISRLEKLESINLLGSRIGDEALSHLSQLKRLNSLTLEATNVSGAGLVHLSQLSNLTYLNLWRSRVTDAGLEHLGGLTALEELNLAGNHINGSGLHHLSRLQNLLDLGLGGTDLNDEGLPHLGRLNSLKILNLGGTDVTDAGLIHLRPLKQLEQLWLSETKVTDEGVEELQKYLPNTGIE